MRSGVTNMKKKQYLLSALGVFIFSVVVFITAIPSRAQNNRLDTGEPMGEKTYRVSLTQVNNSSVTGEVTLRLNDNGTNPTLEVNIQAQGLEAGKPHAQHIHGFMTGQESVCPHPDPNNRLNRFARMVDDGVLNALESEMSIGPALLPLEPFSMADESGRINYTKTFSGDIVEFALPFEIRAVEIHGLNVNGEYRDSLPVACATIEDGNTHLTGTPTITSTITPTVSVTTTPTVTPTGTQTPTPTRTVTPTRTPSPTQTLTPTRTPTPPPTATGTPTVTPTGTYGMGQPNNEVGWDMNDDRLIDARDYAIMVARIQWYRLNDWAEQIKNEDWSDTQAVVIINDTLDRFRMN